MGVTTSCSGGCGRVCGKTEAEASSRVNNSRQNYDYPGNLSSSPNDPTAEEQLGPGLFEAKTEQWSHRSGLAGMSEVPKEDGKEQIANGVPLKEVLPSGDATAQTARVELAQEAVEVRVPQESKDAGVLPSEKLEDGQNANADSAAGPDRRMSWKKAAKKAMMAKNMGAKIAIENKIGTKLEGWFRDVALELQKGIAAEGRSLEHARFEAPEGHLFNRCRVACGFTPVRYFATMGLQDGLTEPNLALIGGQDAAGKSGSFFFLSPDQQLIAKSCTKEDWVQLLRILPDYVEFVEAARAKANAKVDGERRSPERLSQRGLHNGTCSFVRGFTETLLPRFLGLYKLTLPGDDPKSDVRVLIMANVFGGAMSIERRYDLKGSTHGRKASKKECAKKAPTYKDIDWVAKEPGLGLSIPNREMLLEAIRLDLDFLDKHGLMDYSLLVGVHDIAQDAPSVYEAMNVVTVRDQTRHCYLGIIDVLTPYRIKKRAETFFMGSIVCGRDISCQHPSVYARRFKRFTERQVFPQAALL